MARLLWKNRSWLRKFIQHLRRSERVPLDQGGLVPESYFLEKLTLEGKRALRSHKPLVLMIVELENGGAPAQSDEIVGIVGTGLNDCVRESDICGLLKKDTLIGVILTEVEAEKIGSAQLVVAQKTRERLAALLSLELANRITITFRIFPATGGRELFDLNRAPELSATGGGPRNAARTGLAEGKGNNTESN
jgi:hypothetical protein